MKRLIALTLASLLGCGDEDCEIAEDVYEVQEQYFIPNEECSVDKISATIDIKRYEDAYGDSKYSITCRAEPLDSHEFFLFRKVSYDAQWELMFTNGETPMLWATTTSDVKEMSDYSHYRCAIRGMQQRLCDSAGNCSLEQSLDYYGAVEAQIQVIKQGLCKYPSPNKSSEASLGTQAE